MITDTPARITVGQSLTEILKSALELLPLAVKAKRVMAEDNSTEKNRTDERRETMRKKLIVNVEYHGGDATGVANTRDIGVGGLYLTTGAEFAVGDVIQMTFGVGDRQITLGGTVIYTDPGQGVGVRFRDPEQDDIEALVSELDLAKP